MPILLVVGVFVFLLIHITPGDPASCMLGRPASEVEVNHLRTELGLDLQASWITLFPGIAIMVCVLGLNLFGDGLRDVLDPRLRGR